MKMEILINITKNKLRNKYTLYIQFNLKFKPIELKTK